MITLIALQRIVGATDSDILRIVECNVTIQEKFLSLQFPHSNYYKMISSLSLLPELILIQRM